MEYVAVTTKPAAKIIVIVAGVTPCTIAKIAEHGATLRVASVFGIPEKSLPVSDD